MCRAVVMMVDGSVTQIHDGFWLPGELRKALITPDTDWKIEYRYKGREIETDVRGAVGVRWPVLSEADWDLLFQYLDMERSIIQTDFLSRMKDAVSALTNQMLELDQEYIDPILQDLANYTGYSPEMIHFGLNVLDLTPFDTLENILTLRIPGEVRSKFVPLHSICGIDGRLRHYRSGRKRLPFISGWVKGSKYLTFREQYPNFVLGYAAGNVIGTAFLISLLSQLSALVNPGLEQDEGRRLPAILIKNSREEPMFGPLLFNTLERLDPGLVSTVALMIWDYEDENLQNHIVSKADLVLAAAGDFAIGQINEVVQKANPSTRFHKHGHKVSFTTIGKKYLNKGDTSGESSLPDLFEIIANLAAIDSILWDQYGCLSSRIHFIETGSNENYTPVEYGQKLVSVLRSLSNRIPRGGIPLTRIHDRFSFFSAQTYSDDVILCSTYDDDFVVVVDQRPWSEHQFKSIINQCIERTIVIRPIHSILEVPSIYLKWIDEQNLQTLYLAIDGADDEDWSEDLRQFVNAAGTCGITSIRALGQATFPQLAYSWDGYLPQSLSIKYPEGRFTTVEFDLNYPQIIRNFAILTKKI